MFNSVQPHRQQPTRLLCPWASPGKNTGVGFHFLFQCMKGKVKVKLLSPVRLLATPWTVAHQAPLPMEFSKQEYWSGLPYPPPGDPSKSEVKQSEVSQSCPTLCDPMDCSLPGFSVRGILQARILEWGAIGSFQPRDKISISYVFCTGRQVLYY